MDQLLAARGLSRRVALRVPYFHAALTIVAKSDLVLTAPRALMLLAEPTGVVALQCPLPLPQHNVNLVWHQRYSKDPGHAWFRKLLSEVSRTLQKGLA